LTLIGLLVLVAAAVMALVVTRSSPGDLANGKGQSAAGTSASPMVNQQYLETARRLAAIAETPSEQQLARDAVRVADHEVDTAFSIALRMTSEQSSAKTPETRSIEQRIAQTEAEIRADQEKAKQLTGQMKQANETSQEALQEQIEITQAQLALDEDALADAKQDLIRAGGDAHSRIQQLLDEHEAAQHTNQSTPAAPAQPPALFSSSSFIGKCHHYSALRAKAQRLLAAQQDALGAAASLARNHESLEEQFKSERSQSKAPSRLTQPAAAALSSLHHLSDDEKNLADLDKGVQDLQQLGSIYGQWYSLAKSAERSALHDIIGSLLWIVLALLLAFLVNQAIARFFARLALERKQRATLYGVVRFSIQALAMIVILFVIFGTPSQLSTVLGLATAGLTVALKDFIISFLGWFVLMGRHGISVGDWVEINGVRGEVIEIGLLRTILLETGNWTDAGQPTGRQVAFPNSFAVEGYYFNFSTSGQWLWDEIQVLIPAGQNPYPLIEKIRDIVAKETEGYAQRAEQEWQRVTRRYGVRAFSAGPAVNVKPTDLGVQVIMRYVTTAVERAELRYRLNHAVVKLLHQEGEVAPLLESSPAPAASDH